MNRSTPWLLLAALLLGSCGGGRAPEEAAPTAAPSPTARATPSATPAPTPRDPFALARAYDADSPRELAAILDREPGPPELAKRQQAAYRQLVRMPEWRTEVYELLDSDDSDDSDDAAAARANVEAGEELRKLTPPKTELPPWRIVAPPPAAELRSYYDVGGGFGIEWTYLAAIHLVETRMGRIRGTSDAGAQGPMQFLPSTWAAYGEGDINDPEDAIRAAARYLDRNGAPEDMDAALFAYNHSDHYVRAIRLYAERMRLDPVAYDAYYHWDVYYRTTKGDALLYEGWPG